MTNLGPQVTPKSRSKLVFKISSADWKDSKVPWLYIACLGFLPYCRHPLTGFSSWLSNGDHKLLASSFQPSNPNRERELLFLNSSSKSPRTDTHWLDMSHVPSSKASPVVMVMEYPCWPRLTWGLTVGSKGEPTPQKSHRPRGRAGVIPE